MTNQPPVWPRITGTSLLLVPMAYRNEDWERAERVVQASIEHLGIAVARGLSQCPPYISSGATALLGAWGEDALIFACPADIGIFEAEPLVNAGESGVMLDEIATFFRKASETALSLAPKIAWIVAHDWSPSDRVRWDSGDVDSLVRFATSPGAWRTLFLGSKPGQVYESDEWPYWFEVRRGVAER